MPFFRVIFYGNFCKKAGGGGGEGSLTSPENSKYQTSFAFEVIWWVLQSGQVSLKSVRWHVSPLPGPLMETLLIPFLLKSFLKCKLFIFLLKDQPHQTTKEGQHQFFDLCIIRFPLSTENRKTLDLCVVDEHTKYGSVCPYVTETYSVKRHSHQP